MKLFWVNVPKARNIAFTVFTIFALQSCATKHSQFGQREPATITDNFDNPNAISQTFFLIGDAGDSDSAKSQALFSVLSDRLKKADSTSTLLFLGDNIYPYGMPDKNSPDRKLAEVKLENQLELSKRFKGKTIFIPGNHDWYNGIEGLAEQEKQVNDYIKSKKSFLPKNGCGIDHVDISDNVGLIVIDSEWFLEDWDDHPTINENCDIKTREQFFEELESEINKNQNKTTIIAMHHPLQSNGTHGGQFSVQKQIFPLKYQIPLPGIGSLINLIRKTSGLSPQDIQNRKYTAFVKRVKTLIRNKPNIVVVSGHEHNLQYVDTDGVKQIVSGAGSKQEAARAINDNDFSIGQPGYAVLQVLKSGATKVSYYGVDYSGKESLYFKQQPLMARPKPNLREFPNKFAAMKDTAIYTTKMTTKSAGYRFLWGNHYRKYYSMPIHVRQVSLDTLYGGLKPTISGGGHQSRSLRLESKNGREYVMRSLRKSATRFLQSVAFKSQSVEDDFRNTYTEDFILDFYTTAHPYTPFAVAELAKRTGINHTNPVLYYVPKQNTLGLFNDEYGDELYMIEERPTDEFKNLSSFGKPSKIVSTADVLENLKKDEKYIVDTDEYVKARIFDMLIGDWDRHADQWRWGEFKTNDRVIYRPIPRDRDQAFSKYDGNLVRILMNIPALRHMKTFSDKLKNVKWFNREAYNLDLVFAKNATRADWLKQAAIIEKNLTDAEIDKSFEKLPKEVKDGTIDKIKRQLKKRKTHLSEYAAEYFEVLQRTVLIVGTEKKDRFEITRSDKETQVKVFRMKKSGEELISDRKYQRPETQEIWVYGLGDDDVFEVNGYGKKLILLRLMGGADKDEYQVAEGKRVKIYDFISGENNVSAINDAQLTLTDNYEINSYDYEKPKYNFFAGYPLLGYNPDDGVKIGAVLNYTVNGFRRNPFTQKHSVGANYYFATSGYELSYRGNFPHLFGKWDGLLNASYTSPNFSVNFFGFGNETKNFDTNDDQGKDFNRVKISTFRVAPAMRWVGEQGASAILEASFENKKVDETAGRFIAEPAAINPDVFNNQSFADINAKWMFENYDNSSNPTLGMTFWILGGYKVNINQTDRKFAYAESALGFNYKLSRSGNWVLATLMKGRALFDDRYEFYQAATVGGDFDLRGFRNQRFSGRQSFYQSTDVRWNLGKLQNGVAPIRYGVFGGFDYGRVWLPQENSEKWHQSVGGGVWLNGVNILTAKLSLFYSDDGPRFSFGLGFGF